MCLFIPFIFTINTYSQTPTFNEIFRQKRTARRYMARQIAELQIYIELTRKGYELVTDGLNLVRDISNGEFTLHQLFYTSLKTVSPQIRKYPKLKTIIDQQLYIQKLVTSLRQEINKDNAFIPSQRNYINSALDNLKSDTDQLEKQLITILADNKFELSDDQRISQINKLFEKSSSQLQFIHQFSSQALALIHMIQTEHLDNQVIKQLYDLTQ